MTVCEPGIKMSQELNEFTLITYLEEKRTPYTSDKPDSQFKSQGNLKKKYCKIALDSVMRRRAVSIPIVSILNFRGI